MTGWLADTSARYVDRLRDLARYLDTAVRRQADGVPAEHWPPIHDPSRWLRPDFHDLKAACDQAGEAGDAIFLAAVRVFDDVSKVVADYRGSGSVEAWASCRDRVLGDLETISAAAGARPAAEVCRSAPPAAPAPPQAPAGAMPAVRAGVDSRKKGEKALQGVFVLSPAESQFLLVLKSNGATNEDDRLTKENLIDWSGLSKTEVRKAAASLKAVGLINSNENKRGGYWLTDEGFAIADSLDKGRSTKKIADR